ncbi:DUF4350 domain-containing protein [Streptomyces fuscigenes]|uniref:DUF4350 domain-containing protein n=1 Tax=Streptomyces fuscigenes TaxID=1528880 RepID=UPI001F33F748|nr:DUF4350 domain-containing protein [Streptomyces fuscigenes]MCF3961652.1 DUF4350 domain-containing protein [Streptomyces fuscigenes]
MTDTVAPTAPTAPAPVSTSTSPTARRIWTRGRGILLALVLLLAAGLVLAAIGSGDEHGRLDPRAADPLGSRAAAELLKDHGVSVRITTTLRGATSAAGPDSTLLVTAPDLLSKAQQRTLRAAVVAGGGRTVLLEAGPASTPILAPGVDTGTPAEVSALRPRCGFPAAQSAGTADAGGGRYVTDLPGTTACYPVGGMATLLRVPDAHAGETVLLGSAAPLYNDRLGKRGNASLALQILGSRPHLVWYLPSLSDASASDGGGQSAFLDLIPSGWLWGFLQLLIAAGLAAVWRARRLGPLVAERLPVAVPAAEATEGRARLYRSTRSRDRAAAILRAATRERLAPLLGIRPADAHSPETLTSAVSALLPSTDLDLPFLLFGPAPSDDSALVRLADQLDALEREVRTS